MLLSWYVRARYVRPRSRLAERGRADDGGIRARDPRGGRGRRRADRVGAVVGQVAGVLRLHHRSGRRQCWLIGGVERGSAAVEFALLLPILLLLLLALVQVGVIARDSLAAHAGLARRGARGRRAAVERCGRRRGPRGRRRSGPGTDPSRGRVERSPGCTGDGVRCVRRADRVAARRVVVPRVRLAPGKRDDASGVRVTSPPRADSWIYDRSRPRGARSERGSVSLLVAAVVAALGRALDGRRGRRSRAPRGLDGTDGGRRRGPGRGAGARDRRGGTRRPRDLASEYAARNGGALEACECEPGTFEATVSVRMAVGDLFLVAGDRTVLARARAGVDLPAP